jgi:hypothetical protein
VEYAEAGPGEWRGGLSGQIDADIDIDFERPAHAGVVGFRFTARDGGAAWDAFSRGSAIRRAGRAGFARNVCVGLGNWGPAEAVQVLTPALSDPDPLVRTHAAWALGRVGSVEAKEALVSRASLESEDSVKLSSPRPSSPDRGDPLPGFPAGTGMNESLPLDDGGSGGNVRFRRRSSRYDESHRPVVGLDFDESRRSPLERRAAHRLRRRDPCSDPGYASRRPG